jgi:hypothetical protein
VTGTPDTNLNVTTDYEDDRLDLEDVVGSTNANTRGSDQDWVELLSNNDDEEDPGKLYRQLLQAWRHEIQAPTVLPLDYSLVQSWSHRIAAREEALDHQHAGNSKEPVWSLMQSILRVDLERVRYLLCDLLRIRLFKLQQYPWYYLAAEQQDRLTPPEVRAC